jgi:glycosyltransferase involved in cell wall biosynthesis
VLEAWAAGTTVLVNGLCPPTRGHVARSGGGLWYDGYASFAVALEHLMCDDARRAAMGRAGRRYVEASYTWGRVLERYQRFLTGVLRTRAQVA